MLQALFHAWERRLADVTKDRVVRPFDWGLDWIPTNGHVRDAEPARVIGDWISGVMADTDAFFTPPPTTAYTLQPAGECELLTFPSALETPHTTNNTVYARLFPAKVRLAASAKATALKKPDTTTKPAVLVMPQWNSDPGGHVGLCRLLA